MYCPRGQLQPFIVLEQHQDSCPSTQNCYWSFKTLHNYCCDIFSFYSSSYIIYSSARVCNVITLQQLAEQIRTYCFGFFTLKHSGLSVKNIPPILPTACFLDRFVSNSWSLVSYSLSCSTSSISCPLGCVFRILLIKKNLKIIRTPLTLQTSHLGKLVPPSNSKRLANSTYTLPNTQFWHTVHS